MTSFEQLTAPEITANSAKLLHMFDRALLVGEGELTAEDLLNLALTDRLYVFVGRVAGVIRFAAAFEFYVSPRKKWLHATAYVGKAAMFWECLPYVLDWAKANGATELRCFGKEPQMRLARRQGFKEIYRVCSLEIPS